MSEIRELTLDEIDYVSGALSSEEAGQIAAVLGAGAALTGATAAGTAAVGLVPAAAVAGAISATLAIGAAGFGIYAAFAD